MSILLVEDNGSVRLALKEALETLGYQVYDAANGPEALALLQSRQQRVDLVVSDMIMPYMNALELYEALQEIQQNVKMLVITGYPMPFSGESLVARPGVRWASKPIGIQQLNDAVRQMIAG